ncbi:response regulator transcription factor [Streptomyces sp. NPDC057580]|uniref:helix-turn-helix transcriptional regulator n=1 Tax=Streptomyces sp. NPDC057580 TaxID=3346173 RepID=UPI0036B74AFF
MDSWADTRRLGAHRMEVLAEVGFRAARGHGAAAGIDAMDALREIVPAEAYELVVYDSVANRHHSLTFDGYSPENPELGAVEFPRTEAFREAIALRGPTRMNEPGSDFAQTPYFQDYIAPYGWRAGLTAPLFLRDGRYTGMLHLSAFDPEAFDEETSEVIRAVSPVLAHVTDVMRHVDSLGLPQGCSALAFEATGSRRPLTGRPFSAAIAAEPRMADLAREFLSSRESHRRGLWQDRTGHWRDLHLVRSASSIDGTPDCAVLAERPCRVPYGLTPRELDVLGLIAHGDSNPEIAARLVLSVRTVTTHIVHIFDKLGCDSRVRAAGIALREGLVRVGFADV